MERGRAEEAEAGAGGNQVDLIRKHAPSLDDLQMRESAGMEGSCWMEALTRSGALEKQKRPKPTIREGEKKVSG